MPDASSPAKVYTAKSYSPYATRSFPDKPLRSDKHLHASTSLDAGAFGNRLDARAAYRRAQAEEVTSTTGFAVQLSRFPGWLVVGDDSDNVGLFDLIYAGDRGITSEPDGDVLALAHGGNLANGIMFPLETRHRRLLR